MRFFLKCPYCNFERASILLDTGDLEVAIFSNIKKIINCPIDENGCDNDFVGYISFETKKSSHKIGAAE